MAFRYTTYNGTSGNDSWTNICDTVYFGLDGDDVMVGATGENQLVVGGAGNDTYRPINNNLVTIYDNAGTADRLELAYVDLTSNKVYWGVIEGQHLYFLDYGHAQGAIVLDFNNSGVIETYVLGGKSYSHSQILDLIGKEQARAQTQDAAYFRGDLTWESSGVLPAGYSRAEAVDGYAKIGVPAKPVALNSTATDELQALTSANLGILRSPANANDLIPLANQIDAGQLGMTAALNALIAKAAPTTAAALVMTNVVMGIAPSSSKLDSLTAFAKTQFESKGYQDTGHAYLGGYEALGLAYASTAEFSTKFAGGTTSSFIASSYKLAFGREATALQAQHFQQQIDYFVALYHSAGFADSASAVGARGAVLGQMLGFATEEAGNSWLRAANAFLLDASDGSAPYGVPLTGLSASSLFAETL